MRWEDWCSEPQLANVRNQVNIPVSNYPRPRSFSKTMSLTEGKKSRPRCKQPQRLLRRHRLLHNQSRPQPRLLRNRLRLQHLVRLHRLPLHHHRNSQRHRNSNTSLLPTKMHQYEPFRVSEHAGRRMLSVWVYVSVWDPGMRVYCRTDE